MATLTDRATRQQLFEKSVERAERGDANDTRLLLAEIVQLRAKKAALFGNPDWATYQMWDRMAKDPRTALGFMERVSEEAVDHKRRPDMCIDDYNHVRVTIANPHHADLTRAEERLAAKVDAVIERHHPDAVLSW